MTSPGSVNATITCNIKAGDAVVGTCNDTPNAKAYGMAKHPDATHCISFYPGWADSITTRESLADRIIHKGWMTARKANYRKA